MISRRKIIERHNNANPTDQIPEPGVVSGAASAKQKQHLRSDCCTTDDYDTCVSQEVARSRGNSDQTVPEALSKKKKKKNHRLLDEDTAHTGQQVSAGDEELFEQPIRTRLRRQQQEEKLLNLKAGSYNLTNQSASSSSGTNMYDWSPADNSSKYRHPKHQSNSKIMKSHLSHSRIDDIDENCCQINEDRSGKQQAEASKRVVMSSTDMGTTSTSADYRKWFDPYSVYGDDDDEDEDVWYSEERLFEVSND